MKTSTTKIQIEEVKTINNKTLYKTIALAVAFLLIMGFLTEANKAHASSIPRGTVIYNDEYGVEMEYKSIYDSFVYGPDGGLPKYKFWTEAFTALSDGDKGIRKADDVNYISWQSSYEGVLEDLNGDPVLGTRILFHELETHNLYDLSAYGRNNDKYRLRDMVISAGAYVESFTNDPHRVYIRTTHTPSVDITGPQTSADITVGESATLSAHFSNPGWKNDGIGAMIQLVKPDGQRDILDDNLFPASRGYDHVTYSSSGTWEQDYYFDEPGNYTLEITPSDKFQGRDRRRGDTVTHEFEVLPADKTIIADISASPRSAEVGEQVTIYDNSREDSDINWRQWTTPNSGVESENLSTDGSGGTISFSTIGEYEIELMVSDAWGPAGTNSTDSTTINVVDSGGGSPGGYIEADISASKSTVELYEDVTIFDNSSSSDPINHRNWTTTWGAVASEDLSEDGSGGTISFRETGVHEVELFVASNAGTDIDTVSLNVVAPEPPEGPTAWYEIQLDDSLKENLHSDDDIPAGVWVPIRGRWEEGDGSIRSSRHRDWDLIAEGRFGDVEVRERTSRVIEIKAHEEYDTIDPTPIFTVTDTNGLSDSYQMDEIRVGGEYVAPEAHIDVRSGTKISEDTYHLNSGDNLRVEDESGYEDPNIDLDDPSLENRWFITPEDDPYNEGGTYEFSSNNEEWEDYSGIDWTSGHFGGWYESEDMLAIVWAEMIMPEGDYGVFDVALEVEDAGGVPGHDNVTIIVGDHPPSAALEVDDFVEISESINVENKSINYMCGDNEFDSVEWYVDGPGQVLDENGNTADINTLLNDEGGEFYVSQTGFYDVTVEVQVGSESDTATETTEIWAIDEIKADVDIEAYNPDPSPDEHDNEVQNLIGELQVDVNTLEVNLPDGYDPKEITHEWSLVGPGNAIDGNGDVVDVNDVLNENGGTLLLDGIGVYDIVLTVFHGKTEASDRDDFEVWSAVPIADFTMPSFANQGDTVAVEDKTRLNRGVITDLTWKVEYENGAEVSTKDVTLNLPTGHGEEGTIEFHQDNTTEETYTVELTATSSSGDTDTIAREITVINDPPVIDFWLPREVMQGEDFDFYNYSYDPNPNAEIENFEWSITPSQNDFIGDLSVEEPGGYFENTPREGQAYEITFEATDSFNVTNEGTREVEVEPAIPTPSIFQDGYRKQNRKFIVDGNNSFTPQDERYSIVDYEWEVIPQQGQSPDSIKIRNSSDLSVREILFREDGDYQVRLRVKSSSGHWSEWTSDTYNINPDLSPVAEINLSRQFMYRGDEYDNNKTGLELRDFSYSPDGDYIDQRIWHFKYDSNNDGDWNNENWIGIHAGNEAIIEFIVDDKNNRVIGKNEAGQTIFEDGSQNYGVGRYLFTIEVVEGFGEPTLPEFITAEDYRSSSTINHSRSPRTMEIDNRQPTTDFEAIQEYSADVAFIVDEDLNYSDSDILDLANQNMVEILNQNNISATFQAEEVMITGTDPGEGTASNPYLIDSRERLRAVEDDLDAHYKLVNNIDLSGKDWDPIGGRSDRFTGTFDGNGFVISNMTINSGSYTGLFASTSRATITDLGLENVDVNGSSRVGALIGRMYSGLVDNCYSTGSVEGSSQRVGGLIGRMWGPRSGGSPPTVTNSYSTADVRGHRQVGGFVGRPGRAHISDCYSTGSVTGTGGDRIGGFAGRMWASDSCTIQYSYTTGRVRGNGGDMVGGFVGYLKNSTIQRNYVNNSVSSPGGSYVDSRVGLSEDGGRARWWRSSPPGDSEDAGQLNPPSPIDNVGSGNIPEKLESINWDNNGRFIFLVSENELDDLVDDYDFQSSIFSQNANFSVLGSSGNQSDAEHLVSVMAASEKNAGIFEPINIENSLEVGAEHIVNMLIPDEEREAIYYVICDQETLEHELFVHDPEDDPMIEERWYYDHDYTYFANDLGRASFSDNWILEPVTTFDRPGKYEVIFQTKDDPALGDTRFENYQKWSHMLHPQIIYAIRRPEARFSIQLEEDVDAGNFIVHIDEDSRDLDMPHIGDNGIADKEWRWQYADGSWNTGKPGRVEENREFFVALAVEDYFGLTDTRVESRTTGQAGLNPVAKFTVENAPITTVEELEISESSYDPNAGGEIVTWEWTLIDPDDNIKTSYETSNPDNFPKNPDDFFNIPTIMRTDEDGEELEDLPPYELTLRVKNDIALWSSPVSDFVEVTPSYPTADFRVVPRKPNGERAENFNINDDPIPQDVFKIEYDFQDYSTCPAGGVIINTEWQYSKDGGSWTNDRPTTGIINDEGIGEYDIRLRVQSSATGLWSENWSNIRTITVVPPNLEPEPDISISPNPATAGKDTSFVSLTPDNSGDGSQEKEWRVRLGGITLRGYDSNSPPSDFQAQGWGDDGVGNYTISLRVTNIPDSELSPIRTNVAHKTYRIIQPLDGTGFFAPGNASDPAPAGIITQLRAWSDGYADRLEFIFPGDVGGGTVELEPDMAGFPEENTWKGEHEIPISTQEGEYSVTVRVTRETTRGYRQIEFPITLHVGDNTIYNIPQGLRIREGW